MAEGHKNKGPKANLSMTRKKFKSIWLLPLALLLILISIFAFNDKPKIINIHESIEDETQLAKLIKIMQKTGTAQVVLHGIPYEMLHFTGEDLTTYSQVDESNTVARDAARLNPWNISFFCTLDPHAFDLPEKAQDCFDNGALGIKLYNGYHAYHTIGVDNPDLLPLYEKMASEEKILMLPLSTSNYQTELENLLTLNPDLTVICPHYCLSSKRLDVLKTLLDKYPNLYIDTSFGHIDYTEEGFQTIKDNIQGFQMFFDEYQDRIFFATDNVLTSFENKDEDFFVDLYKQYISIFEDTLKLSDPILDKIFYKNWYNLTEL